MADTTVGITLEGRDNASAAIKEVGAALEETKGKADETGSAFERIKAGFESGMGFAAGITGFRELKDILEGLGDATVNFNASLEQTSLRLENLTGSAQGSVEAIQAMKELSDASPFTFKELETANERLLRFNFSTERAAELVKVASDAAAGMGAGAGGVDTITEAFGRMNSRTELTQRGIMALVGMGVPAFDMLAKGLGITTAQAEDLTKKGLIPSVDAIQILSSALETKYPEMGAKIGGTFDSLKKTIADTMDFMFAELGKPVFDVLENAAKDWLAWLQSPMVKEAVTEFAGGLSEALKAMGEAFNAVKGPIGDFANDVKSVAGGALQFVADRLADTGAALAGWSAQAGESGKVADAALTGTSDVVQALQFLVQGNFTAAWKTAGDAIGSFRAALDPIKQILEDNRTLIVGIAAAFGTFAVIETVTPLIVGATGAITGLVAAAEGIAAWGAVGGVGGAIEAVGLLLGGPLVVPLLAVSAAIGTVAAAWITNWGDIQGKTVSAVDDMKAAWENLKEAGTMLWGMVRDAFLPAQDDFNKALSGSAGSADASATNAASAIKGVTSSIRDFTGMLTPALGVLQSVGDGLNAVKRAGDDFALMVHNSMIASIKDLLSPLQNVLDALRDLELFVSKTFHINIDIPGVQGILDSLDKIHSSTSVINATGVGGPGGIPNLSAQNADASAAFERPSQFSDPQLSADEALAACGPAALVAFMRTSGGRVPTLREAATMANTPAVGGWNTDVGMASGISGEQNLLSSYGLSSQMNQAPSESQIQAGANSGSGEIIDTLHHFFTASGFDASSGKYNVGTSGTDLVGGSAQMTLSQMTGLMGQVTGILTDIKGSTAATADATVRAGGSGSKEDLITYARGAAERQGISPDVFQRQIQQESGFDPSVRSGAGAVGIAQFMPATAKGRGLDPSDALASLDEAAKYDAELLKKYGGSWEKTLAAYNAGEGHVASGATNSQETSDYLKIILGGANTTGSFTSPGGASNTSSAQGDAAGTVALTDRAQAELAKLEAGKKAATGETGIAELGKLSATTEDWLAASETKEQKKLTSLDTTAAKATAKVDTDTTDKITDLGTQRGITADIKARKDALTERIQDETVANQIATAADALRTKRAAEDDALASSRKREDDNVTHAQELAHEALLHTRTLQDTEIRYQQGLQLEATAHARTLENAKIVADQKLQDQATVHSRVLQDAQIQDGEQLQIEATAHARKLQDQQIIAGEQLKDDATLHQQQLAQEQVLVNAKLSNAALVHQRALQDAQAQPTEDLSNTATSHSRGLQDQDTVYAAQQTQIRGAAALQVSLAAATTDVQKQQINATYQANVTAIALAAKYAAEDLAHKRQMEDQEAAYQEALQVTALAKSRALQDAETQYQAGIAAQNVVAANARSQTEADYQAGLAAVALDLSRRNADTEQSYKDQLADVALQKSRANADKELVYQRGLQAVALQVSRANADIEQTYKEGLARTALDHSRSLQDTEVQYQIGVAHTALMRKRDEEDTVRAETRAKEDAQIAHTIALNAAARAFAKAEKDQQDALDKKLADEAYARQVDALRAEAVIAKQNIADKLNLDKQAAIESAQSDRDTRIAAFNEAAAAIIAKSKTAVEAAGGDFGPIETKMTDTVHAMDVAFSTAHDTSSAALSDLARQAVDALGTSGKLPTAAQQAAAALTAQLGDNSPAAKAIEVSDKAVELFAQQFGVSWEQARPLLGDIEQGIYTHMGENGLIPHHIGVSDQAVEKFAAQWGISWNEARPILETTSERIKTTFGVDVPDQMGKSTTAAGTLNTAIQGIKDKTITVTTKYESNGQAGGNTAGGNQGLDMTRSSGSGGGGSSSGGGGDPQSAGTAPSGSIAQGHAGSSGPGGIYNDPSTGHPYAHALGGVTTSAIFGRDSKGSEHTAGEAGPEAIIPLGDYFVSHKSDGGGAAIDYDKLAAAIAKQPIIVQMNGQAVAELVRTEMIKTGARSGSIFGGRA